jgi:hypothetical protein
VRARKNTDDGTPPAEREFRAWNEFDDLLDDMSKRLGTFLEKEIVVAAMKAPAVDRVLVSSVEEVYGLDYPYPNRPESFFVQRARDRGPKVAAKGARAPRHPLRERDHRQRAWTVRRRAQSQGRRICREPELIPPASHP